MSGVALRLAVGIVSGLAAGYLADLLPARLGLVPASSSRTRAIRFTVAVTITAACLVAYGERDGVQLALATVLTTTLVAAAAVDAEHMVLPNVLTFGGAALALAASVVSGSILRSAAGAVLGLVATVVPHVLYRALRRRSGVGFGDAKLLVFVGAWLGPVGVLASLFVGAVASVACAVVLRALGVEVTAPASVRRELEELRAAAAAGDREAEAALHDDPMAGETKGGVLETRLPFGPFLGGGALLAAVLPRGLERVLAWIAGG